MNPTVSELMEMFTEPSIQKVSVYDLATEDDIFSGTLDEMPENIQDLRIESIDCIEADGVFRVNVSTEEDD